MTCRCTFVSCMLTLALKRLRGCTSLFWRRLRSFARLDQKFYVPNSKSFGKIANFYFVFSHHNSSEPEEKIKREKNFIALPALINVSWMISSRELRWTVSSLRNLFYSSPLTLLELGWGYVNTDEILYCLIVQKEALYVSRSHKLFFVKLSTGNRIEKNIHPFKLRNGKCSAIYE